MALRAMHIVPVALLAAALLLAFAQLRLSQDMAVKGRPDAGSAADVLERSARMLRHFEAQSERLRVRVAAVRSGYLRPPGTRAAAEGAAGAAAAQPLAAGGPPSAAGRGEAPPDRPAPPAASPADRDSPGGGKRVLLFTMDAIDSYVASAKRGGPAGEIAVRKALVGGLRSLGFAVDVARSDDEFQRMSAAAEAYDLFVLDAWTWAGKGWKPRPFLVGRERQLYILDFFGREQLQRKGGGLPGFPAKHILTAFPTSPSNTFLGFWVPQAPAGAAREKQVRGVVWGKAAKYLAGGAGDALRAIADRVRLVSTVRPEDAPLRHPNIEYVGHQTKEQWEELLSTSLFLVGTGDPLLGPSALDAVARGCVYIDPAYAEAKVLDGGVAYGSQHPYLAKELGAPHVCAAQLGDTESFLRCVDHALRVGPGLAGAVPDDFTEAAYRARLRRIFVDGP